MCTLSGTVFFFSIKHSFWPFVCFMIYVNVELRKKSFWSWNKANRTIMQPEPQWQFRAQAQNSWDAVHVNFNWYHHLYCIIMTSQPYWFSNFCTTFKFFVCLFVFALSSQSLWLHSWSQFCLQMQTLHSSTKNRTLSQKLKEDFNFIYKTAFQKLWRVSQLHFNAILQWSQQKSWSFTSTFPCWLLSFSSGWSP